MRRSAQSRSLVLPVVGLAVAALLAGSASTTAIGRPAGQATSVAIAAPDCPPGLLRESEASLADFAAGATGSCRPAGPESREEVMAANSALTARANGGYSQAAPGAYEAAVAQRAVIARSSAAAATAGSWVPVGKGPLTFDNAGYSNVATSGLTDIGGRIEDLAYDPAVSDHWFAAFANGGIWVTADAGQNWRSIGDNLPTQITGAVAYLKTGYRPTVLAGTGDPAFGGSSYSGLGVFWSANGGATWTKSKGIPAGTLTFSFAHDPARPAIVYAATSKGLYRSADAGRNFRNVVLPTGCTSTTNPLCFFANIVTDVAVKASDRAGKGGGAVLAAVGWRAGQKLNAVGKPQSPRNGLYFSASGAPGSYAYRAGGPLNGFPATKYVGRTALGAAVGPRQNHNYVYALVQDADKFNKGSTALDLPDASGGKVPNNTVLNGLYGSADFGASWTKMADPVQMAAPGSGTALIGASSAGYAPGIQSWYNEWVTPDPTVQSETGVPGRLAFGLEEVWAGSGAIPAVPNTGRYTVVGRYFSGTSCLGLVNPGTGGICPTSSKPTTPQGTTTHPDQHAGLWVPNRKTGGVTLVAGNDGGAYKQALKPGQQLDNDAWGRGIQGGFNTLLPYSAQMAKDGTTVMGLQDNGSAIITPEGKQIAAYGGDGFYVAVDPDDSNTWYEEYTNGDIRVTKDGGKSWTGIKPTGISGALFSTPFIMDPTDANHLLIGGRQVFETTKGRSTTVGTWVNVFDLGTRTKPGVKPASDPTGAPTCGGSDPCNALSAVDTRGNASYVGYCGYCDIVTGGVPFGSGIATNVGGSKDPQAGKADGWHIAKAAGLPKRYITSVRVDPRNVRTVYVTLGGYGRKWIPPGSLGDSTKDIGRGNVYRSTDAGASFTDISGNLPDIEADDTQVLGGKLVVATALGVFVANSGTSGGTYSILGKGLPPAPVFQLQTSPRNSSELIAASYGRGVFRIVTGSGTAAAVRSGSGSAPAAATPGAAAPGAAPAPAAEMAAASPASTPSTRPVASSRPFYRQPAVPIAFVMLLGVFVALGLRRRRSPVL